MGLTHVARVPQATITPITVVAVGDIACKPGDATTSTTCRDAATAKLAQSQSPDYVLALGDEQYQVGS